MNFTVLHDIVQYNDLPNSRIYVSCLEKFMYALKHIYPNIIFYFPYSNLITKDFGYMKLYTNYNLHFAFDKFNPTSTNNNFEFFVSDHEKPIFNLYVNLSQHISVHKLQHQLSQSSYHIKKEELKSKIVDEMILMTERQVKYSLQAYIDHETREFLKDRHEQDQIIENLDRKILQYKEEIKELKSTTTPIV